MNAYQRLGSEVRNDQSLLFRVQPDLIWIKRENTLARRESSSALIKPAGVTAY